MLYIAIAVLGFLVVRGTGILRGIVTPAGSAAASAASAVAAAGSAIRTKIMGLTLDQNNANVTKAAGTAAIMSDIYTFKVPRKTKYHLRPSDTLSLYAKDASAEAVGTDAWELVIRDPNGLNNEVIAQGQYTQIKEFQDSTKKLTLGLSYVVPEDWNVVLRFKATTVLVNASCYIALTGLMEVEVR